MKLGVAVAIKPFKRTELRNRLLKEHRAIVAKLKLPPKVEFYKVPGVLINGGKMKVLSLAVIAAQLTDIPWEDIGKGVIIFVAFIIGLFIFLSLLKRREHKPPVGRTLRGEKKCTSKDIILDIQCVRDDF